jgi:hypothetical protein
VLLETGRAAEAEAVYWQDLNWKRENGWALFGLMQSLRAQGSQEQTEAVELRFRKAWRQADVVLTASRFMDKEKTAIAVQAATAGISGLNRRNEPFIVPATNSRQILEQSRFRSPG